MHEDIDDYESDDPNEGMFRYDDLPREERSLWVGKDKLSRKYWDGKISYNQYLEELDRYFYEILDSKEWEEIRKYKEEKNKKVFVTPGKSKGGHPAIKIEGAPPVWGCLLYLIIIIIIFLVFALTGLLHSLFQHHK